MKNSAVECLLHAAAQAPEVQPNEMPFGFDTRLLAQWRAGFGSEFSDLRHLLRRVVWLSLAVIALGCAGTYHEWNQGDEASENPGDQYAIADSAIGDAFEL